MPKKDDQGTKETAAAALEPDLRTVAEWAEVAGHPPGSPGYWKFSAAKALKGWADDLRLEQGEVEAAVKEQMKQVTR